MINLLKSLGIKNSILKGKKIVIDNSKQKKKFASYTI